MLCLFFTADLIRASSKPRIFGAFCLKNKWDGGSMSELSSEAPNLNNIVGFWCLGSHQRQQSPQSKSAPLEVELGAWGLQIWHGTYGRPQLFWTDTCVWRNKSSPDCLACCAAPYVDFISTQNNRSLKTQASTRRPNVGVTSGWIPPWVLELKGQLILCYPSALYCIFPLCPSPKMGEQPWDEGRHQLGWPRASKRTGITDRWK